MDGCNAAVSRRKWCANRPTLAAFPTQYIFGAFQPNELALDPRRVRSFRKEPLAAKLSLLSL